MKAILLLSDGLFFEGEALGSPGEKMGEVVFNTSLIGYQEILTDPSYKGQIVTMTYPLIGNYGINPEDFESHKPFLEGFIIKENSPMTSNWRAKTDLDTFLKESNIIGIQNIDTRLLTQHLRDKGAQQGIISTQDANLSSLSDKLRRSPGMNGQDLVAEVTCRESYLWKEGEWDIGLNSYIKQADKQEKSGYSIVVYDFGLKRNIVRQLVNHGCQVRVVPAFTPAEEVFKLNPDGVLLSNGPGDPQAVNYAIENIKKLLGKIPVFGICLGHQILGLALGLKIYKLKFGHHGGNHPVKDLETGKIEITSQNHNYNLDPDSFFDALELTHINLYDNSVEGLRHKNLPVFSVQYHPEASPGPHDSNYLFKRFLGLIDTWKGKRQN